MRKQKKGEKINLKTIKKINLTCLAALTLCFSVPHAYAESISWYFKPAKDNARPQCCPEAADFAAQNGAIFLGNDKEKKIYLTFDAGYENGNVEKILDTLKSENVPAAFFVLPQIIKQNTELIVRMKNEGHLICNHSKTHRNMSNVTDFEEFKEELIGAEDILKEVTGYEMDKYYRPPEGTFSRQNLEFASKLGYKTVFWSLAYADWDDNKQMSPQKALELVESRVHNGCVALLHPTSSTNAKILGDFIKDMKAKGYEFCSLADFS